MIHSNANKSTFKYEDMMITQYSKALTHKLIYSPTIKVLHDTKPGVTPHQKLLTGLD